MNDLELVTIDQYRQFDYFQKQKYLGWRNRQRKQDKKELNRIIKKQYDFFNKKHNILDSKKLCVVGLSMILYRHHITPNGELVETFCETKMEHPGYPQKKREE